jgi:parallel beta-helix repeat protein
LAKRKKLWLKAVNEKMPKKEKKKSWKEIQRERQKKQQRVQEAYQVQSEKEAKQKPRKWPKGKILVAVFLIVIIFGVYGAWQFTRTSSPSPSEEPPVIPTEGAIYIRSDGIVAPSTAPISNVGNGQYTVTADIYEPIIIRKDNIVIDGANHLLYGTYDYGSKGIDLTGISQVTIRNLRIENFEYGIYLYSSSDNVFSQNDLINNYCAIWVASSSNGNTISGNKITNNEMYGMWLKDSSDNKISENEFTSHGNYTIYMRASNYTTFSANYLADNKLGIFIYEASENVLYHNNFVNNVNPVSIYNSTNVFDDGDSSGGNYWSNYKEQNPDAQELDASGIWNTPYVIDEYNKDNYPLINQWNLD